MRGARRDAALSAAGISLGWRRRREAQRWRRYQPCCSYPSGLRTDPQLQLVKARLDPRRQANGASQQEKEQQRRREFARPPAPERRSESAGRQRRPQPDQGIEAGALPVLTVEVQPQAELIEREAQTDTVDRRRGGDLRYRSAAHVQIGR